MRVDVHNHVLPEPAVDLLTSEDVYRVEIQGTLITGGNHPPYELVGSFRDPRAKLAELESNGLDAAVVSVSPTIFYYELELAAGEAMCEAVNAGLAGFCRHDADRLRWMAHVPMQDPARAAATLERQAGAGCVGVEIGTSISGGRLDDERFEPFWATAERLEMPVMLHPAYNEPHAALAPYYLQNVIGNMLETTIAVERLICAGVLARHSRLELVLLHSGGYFPYQAGRLRHAGTVRPELEGVGDPWSYLSRLWFDIITHYVQALRYLISRVGAERTVMGTDLPFDIAPPRPVEQLQAAADAATVRRIAEDNPAKLYGFVS